MVKWYSNTISPQLLSRNTNILKDLSNLCKYIVHECCKYIVEIYTMYYCTMFNSNIASIFSPKFETIIGISSS